jgi:hypothetical protein
VKWDNSFSLYKGRKKKWEENDWGGNYGRRGKKGNRREVKWGQIDHPQKYIKIKFWVELNLEIKINIILSLKIIQKEILISS